MIRRNSVTTTLSGRFRDKDRATNQFYNETLNTMARTHPTSQKRPLHKAVLFYYAYFELNHMPKFVLNKTLKIIPCCTCFHEFVQANIDAFDKPQRT